jgi:hypothetical protein
MEGDTRTGDALGVKSMDGIRISRILEDSGENYKEYHYIVSNESAERKFLERIELFSCNDLSGLGLSGGEYTLFRSGRHKNDMPGVFVTGCVDERLSDVCSGMTESGEKRDGGESAGSAGYRVTSDHITLIRDRQGKVFAIEFLTGRDQLFETTIDLDENANILSIKAEVIFNVFLDPGETVRTESIRTALVSRAEEEISSFAKRKAVLYGARNKRRPSVFCTWYFYELNVTLEDVRTNLEIMKKRRLPYDVFQIDEGWEVTLGEYEPNEKFPVSMKDLADEIRDAGFVPGLWSSPFVAHETASVWKAHPEWILKGRDGMPVLFPMNDTVYYVFDITDYNTLEYFRELYHRFTFEWGYTYHKLDFTRAAVIYEDADFCDKKTTLAQAYYRAVRAIREGMGDDAFFLMCGGLYDPIIGLVDAQRTGSDVLSMWSSNINKNGKTAPYTIRQSAMRYYMNRWWANDPDALMVRENDKMQRESRLTLGLLNDDEVKTSVMNQFTGGGIMCQTEPLDQISDERLFEIRHILPVVETKAEPLDVMCEDRFPGAVRVSVVDRELFCICVTNWSDTVEKELVVNMNELSLEQGAKYAVSGFYSGRFVTDICAEDTVNMGMLAPHASEVIKIEKLSDSPVILASDYHYTMGGECIVLEMQKSELVVEVKNLLPVEIEYKVLLPKGYSCDGNRLIDVHIDKEDADVHVRRIQCDNA